MDEDLPPQHRMPPPKPEAGTTDRAPGRAGPGMADRLWSRMRSSKALLFGAMGFGGGALGAVFAQAAPAFGPNPGQLILATGAWMGIAAAVLAVGLFLGNELYLRRNLTPALFRRAFLSGLVGGAMAGAIAQGLFSFKFGSPIFHDLVIRTLCWAFLGGMLGAYLSRSIPNLGVLRGALGGVIGGALGGLGFLGSARLLAAIAERAGANPDSHLIDIPSQMLGIGLLGLALGLAMVVIEKLFREASLEVIWAPSESTLFNLGAQPIQIGGGREDQVFVRGLKERHASIQFQAGVVEFVESSSGHRTSLKNGSSLQIGTVRLVIHAAR